MITAKQKIELILKDVWKEVRDGLGKDSFIRFGFLQYTMLHSLENNVALIAIPKTHFEESQSVFMEHAKIGIQQRIAEKTGLFLEISFNSDLF
jgi:hypothetical protein